MKQLRFIWKHIGTRVWMIITSVLLVFCIAIPLVVTQVPLINGTLNIVFGGRRAKISGGTGLYESDYKTKAEVLSAANELNERIVGEGIILLKNDEVTAGKRSLPIAENSRVTVFGKNSVDLVYGGSGSGGGTSNISPKTLYDSLSAANIKYNPEMKKFYDNDSRSGHGRAKNPEMGDIIAGFSTSETSIDKYDAAVKNSYKNDYKDAAIVVLSRIGGEGFDLPRTMKTSYASGAGKVPGARNADDHYLQLDENETAMIKEACDNFDNVIIVINAAQTLELGFLDDPAHYAYNEKIKSVLWMGLPGNSGVMALGKVLVGKINPSGRTTDTYARNFKDDPTFKNIGNNNTDNGDAYLDSNGNASGYYLVQYEEGIYVGYRYYETRGAVDGETWYRNNVVFPFGYGIGYSDFTWNVTATSVDDGAAVTSDTEIAFTVEVTNNGVYDGKDVLQLYYTAPYKPNINGKKGIEKSHKVLADFVKTELIPAGESRTYTLSLKVSDMKSYDYNDDNGNGFKGYELESGDYSVCLSRNAHDAEKTVTVNLADDVLLRDDDKTGYDIVNRFDDVSAGIENYFSRSNFTNTFPTVLTADERKVSREFLDSMTYRRDDAGKPWESGVTPAQGKKASVSLFDVVGKEYGAAEWDAIMDSLTVEEMADLIGTGAFGTLDISRIDKPLTTDSDGPSGFTNFMAMSDGVAVYDTCFYAAECVLGATWNEDLAFEMGEMAGNEGLVGNARGDGMPYSGWYAPAVNIHRSPFSGRNWEYYSEDGYLSGVLASKVVEGAKSKGVYCFVKHFAVNDQETHRDANGICVWANEQSMREIYLKPFEMTVKDGGTTAMMSSFNRLGTTWAGGSYALLTEVLRNEWGFNGMVITDFNLSLYMNVNQMIRAGGDLVLNQEGKKPSLRNLDATQATLIRKAAKNILYTVANSNAMNVKISGYLLPLWQVYMILAVVGIVVACAAWGAAVIAVTYKKEKAGAYRGKNGGDAPSVDAGTDNE